MSEYLDNLLAFNANPNLIIGYVLDDLERQVAGKGSYDIPDASHPFVFAIENGVMMATMQLTESRSLTQSMYPSLAITTEDLYKHMTDDDYLNRFANGAFTNFEFYFNYEELVSRMVADTDGTRKLIIPKLTSVTVADTTFTTQYSIIIRQMRHGGIQVTFDMENTSPLQVLESNIVETKNILMENQRYIIITVPTVQVKVKTYTETLNPTLPFESVYSFSNQFCHLRAYISHGTGWREIKVTHSDQVFDQASLTIVAKVANGKVYVSMPLVYTTLGTATGEIRFDLYETLGEIDIDLGGYSSSEYRATFVSIDDNKTYTNPLTQFNQLAILNPNRVRGGANAITFEMLRNNVMNNVIGQNQLPITNVALTNYFERRGYTLVSNVDNITNRQFLAIRQLPTPTHKSATSAGVMMGQLQLKMDELANSVHVKDNGSRMTILPTKLYTIVKGVVTPVLDSRLDAILNSNAEAKIRLATEGNFVYSPFHYVLDTTNNNFDVRPYYFGKPEVVRRSFVGMNDTSALQAVITEHDIVKTDYGFRLTVVIQGDEAFTQVGDVQIHVQLGYKPEGESQYTGMQGTLINVDNNERTYQFDIRTNWDVNSNNELLTTNLSMFDVTQNNFSVKMLHDFDISICIGEGQVVGYVANEMDRMVQKHLLPYTYMVVTRERLTLRLGYELNDLWRRNRTIIGPESYQYYTDDVYAYWDKVVYDTDVQGNRLILNPVTGELEYRILHNPGDPVLDEFGNPQIKHYRGDPVLDHNGQPVLIAPRGIMREFTLFLVDGLYYFATEENTVNYRNDIPMQVVTWIHSDIADIRRKVLDVSEVYLSPVTTHGVTNAVVKDGIKTDMRLDQSISIIYYLNETQYRNTALREVIISSTHDVIRSQFNNKRIVRSDIINSLRAVVGDEVIGIEVNGLGGTKDFGVVTLSDEAVRLSVRKKLTVLTNHDITVDDDINITFLKH